MQYTVAHLSYSFSEEWEQELFEQAMCDMGFEVFDENNAYIQKAVLQEQHDAIEQLIDQTDGVSLISWEDCPDENWNAQWEAEHECIELPLGVRITPHCAFGAGHHETTSITAPLVPTICIEVSSNVLRMPPLSRIAIIE